MILSRREKVLLALCLVTALAAAMYYFVYSPIAGKLTNLQRELHEKTQQLAELRRWQSKNGDIEERIADLEERLQGYQQRLKEVGTMPQLILYLERLEEKTGVTLTNILPVEKGLSLAMKGEYHQIKAFIQGLEQLENIYQVRSLNLTAQPDGILCNLTAEFKSVQIDNSLKNLFRQSTIATSYSYGKENPFEP